MSRVGVGVVRRPRVVHRNICEPREDSGVVDPGAAAFGVAGDQGVLAGAGAVHPVQRAGHPQPSLVEPGDIGLGDLLFHGAEEAAEPVGGAFGHRRDGALRDRGVEQFGHRLRGALLRQELSHIQIRTTAVIRGPYWTGAVTPSGAAARWWPRSRSGARPTGAR